ncbi:MAG: histidinol phosphate phosphatase [Tardiphaga sp.]|nr:histidinol phosphate phosphatase [Tardiphaga sp.]
MSNVNLKSLSVPQLLSLRSDIDVTLQARRSELQAQLAEIGGGGGGSASGRTSRIKGSKVAAKYRHPKTGETWSGRGGVAGWLAAELKAGKKREDFLIGGGKPAKAKAAKKRKAKAE